MGEPKSRFFGDAFVIADGAYPAVTTLADGVFVAVNIEQGKIAARFMDFDGTWLGSKFNITTTEHYGFQAIQVLGMADGGFVVAWEDRPGGSVDQMLRVMNADGTARTPIQNLNVPTNEGPDNFSLDLTRLGEGLLATWTSTSDDATDRFSSGILERRFDNQGRALDDAEWLNTARSGYQEQPASATLKDGSVVVAFRDSATADIRISLLDKNGKPATAEIVYSVPDWQSAPDVAALADGRFALIANTYLTPGQEGIVAQIFEIDRSGAGSKVLTYGPMIELAAEGGDVRDLDAPHIVGTAGSGFFAAWVVGKAAATGSSFYEHELFGQFFKADGTPDGAAFQIAAGRFGSDLAMELAESKNGSILLNWTEVLENSDGGITMVTKARLVKAPAEAPSIDDLIQGTSGDDTRYGGGGNDTIYGRAGDDKLNGDAGSDKLYGGTGNDTLRGGTGADRLDGGSGTDMATYSTAAAGVTVSLSETKLNTGEAKGDTFISVEYLTGSKFADKLYGNSAANSLRGGSGNDLLRGGGSADSLEGHAGSDTLEGHSGNDTLNGGMDGDKLTGGLGKDTLAGGAGADRFIYTALSDSTSASSGRDIIVDFTRGHGDKIDLLALDARTKSAGNQAFKFIGDDGFSKSAGELRFKQDGGKTYVQADVDGNGATDFIIQFDLTRTFIANDFVL